MAIGKGSSNGDGWIELINLENEDLVERNLKGYGRKIFSLAFSRDGKYLASASDDRKVSVWDLQAGLSLGKLLPKGETLGPKDTTFNQVSVAISPDGKTIAAANIAGTVVEWNTANHQPLYDAVKSNSEWTDIAYTPNNVLRRISYANKTITVYEGANARSLELPYELLRLPATGTWLQRRLAVSGDGNILATQAPDGPVTVWELTRLERQEKMINAHKECISLTLSKDGSRLAAYDRIEKKVLQWETVTGEQKGSVALGESDLGQMAFSSDGERLAIGTKDDKIIIWNTSDKTQTSWFLTGDKKNSARSIAFSRDGKTLAVGTVAGPIIFFDLTAGPLIARSQLTPSTQYRTWPSMPRVRD